ncbi:thioesterase [Mycolicibacterium novocastrense]|uniref:PaaI family thioesterase n=1 Tax=Mycolicibacterium novocastrense TaxID=59813 RepID=UPI00074A0F0C|nr:PaaI family thioesterase [Mycolicibacterium novocastrense]KUH69802.1 thioesterase [Mycolicibacterium novocastrense]KUH71351.1 thioesterase [Mycolicibacterium novocastrense]KUH74415.1 thioesterase [Mycolicibacterium novocastrense]
MDFGFDVISAETYEHHRALYEPLTAAIRKLIGAGIRTDVDEKTAREAQAAIDSVTALLETKQRATTAAVRHKDTGRPLTWANPAVGVGNAIAPPMVIHHEADGRAWSEFHLSDAYEGPPGRVHGGICALVLDQIVGETASSGLSEPNFTGTITVKYLRATPLGKLRAEASIVRIEGVKTFARGCLIDAEGTTVEAEGVFIRPVWARDGA